MIVSIKREGTNRYLTKSNMVGIKRKLSTFIWCSHNNINGLNISGPRTIPDKLFFMTLSSLKTVNIMSMTHE
jgi:hypothetical protein